MIMVASGGEEIERLRVHYLGKKGILAEIAAEIPKLPPEDKAEIGEVFNDVKQAISNALGAAQTNIQATNSTTTVDTSLPGVKPPLGHLHPVTKAIEEISSIFEKIGFVRVRYPEVDWDWYAFESLNMPKSHPASDDIETFFVDAPENSRYGKMVLTPQTSNGQVREMERLKAPPIRMINIAKCYRRQS